MYMYVYFQLADTPISFDGGLTTMNFAQAAMLVQSSACVYSKKVKVNSIVLILLTGKAEHTVNTSLPQVEIL